jgi:hypothetical protein
MLNSKSQAQNLLSSKMNKIYNEINERRNKTNHLIQQFRDGKHMEGTVSVNDAPELNIN